MKNLKQYTDSLEIDDIPWNRMVTAYGTAENYPELLEVLDGMKDLDEVKKHGTKFLTLNISQLCSHLLRLYWFFL